MKICRCISITGTEFHVFWHAFVHNVDADASASKMHNLTMKTNDDHWNKIPYAPNSTSPNVPLNAKSKTVELTDTTEG